MTYIADLHVHSCASPDGLHSLQALAAEARRRHVDAFAVCDHDLSTPVESAEGVLLIPATEITTDCGHVLGIFLCRPCDHARLGDKPTVASAVEEIHRCGGLAVLAHPFAPNKAPASVLSEFPVDGIETANARAGLYRDANQQASALAEKMGLFQTGGSDAHHKAELKGAVTKIEAEECSLEALRRAVERGQCSAELLSVSGWRYKGISAMKKHFSFGSFSEKLKSLVYFGGCILRDAVRYRR